MCRHHISLLQACGVIMPLRTALTALLLVHPVLLHAAADAVAGLLAPLPVAKLRQLGGKFGEEIQARLNVSTVGELVRRWSPLQAS